MYSARGPKIFQILAHGPHRSLSNLPSPCDGVFDRRRLWRRLVDSEGFLPVEAEEIATPSPSYTMDLRLPGSQLLQTLLAAFWRAVGFWAFRTSTIYIICPFFFWLFGSFRRPAWYVEKSIQIHGGCDPRAAGYQGYSDLDLIAYLRFDR